MNMLTWLRCGARLTVMLVGCGGAAAVCAQEATHNVSSTPRERRHVLVVGFEPGVEIDARDRWIPTAFEELLTERLRRVHGIIAVPTVRAHQARQELQGPAEDAPAWAKVAAALGASAHCHGTCTGPPSKTRLTLHWVPVDDVANAVHAELRTARLFDVLDAATEWILERAGVRLTPEQAKAVYAPPTSSVSAVEYYSRAVEAARSDELRVAHRRASQAIASDKRFRPVQHLMAQLELRLGDVRSAGTRLRFLLHNARADGDELDRARAELAQSLHLQLAGTFEAATTRARTALEIAERLDDPYARIAALTTLGDQYVTWPVEKNVAGAERRTANLKQAANYKSREIALLEALGDRVALLSATSRLATIHQQLGEKSQAIALHQRTLQVAQGLKSKRHEATAWLYLGNCYREHKQWDKAEHAFAECLDRVEGPARPGVLLLFGDLCMDMGRPNDALAHYEEAGRLLAKVEDLITRLACLRKTAGVQKQLGRQDAAIASLERALELAEALELRESVVLREQLAEWRAEGG